MEANTNIPIEEKKESNEKNPKDQVQEEEKNQTKQPLIKCEICLIQFSNYYCSKCELYYFEWYPTKCKEHDENIQLFSENENSLICFTCYTDDKKKYSRPIKLNQTIIYFQRVINSIQENNIKEAKLNKKYFKKLKKKQKKLQKKNNKLIKKINVSKTKLKKEVFEKIHNQYIMFLNNLKIVFDKRFEVCFKKMKTQSKIINKKNKEIKNLRKLDIFSQKIEFIQRSIILQQYNLPRDQFDKGMKDVLISIVATNQIKSSVKKKKNNYYTYERYNSTSLSYICGTNIYFKSTHKIRIRIDKFQNSKDSNNSIYLGVVDTDQRGALIEKNGKVYSFYFEVVWDGEELNCCSNKISGNSHTVNFYHKNIKLKESDIFIINLDMDKKNLIYQINNQKLDYNYSVRDLPERVTFFAGLYNNNAGNQITLI
ncbi:bonus isoform c-related [Anaeramoeba flamelloides]|uniref:Bonus isoform c-related n=1 Tax=Anaeramoeba flamelloides TaxID=1746091 RepID=A0AAV7ZJ58_9EUKA|nr:bonus isoform c-related [Anaeramoeba flamelloides]